MEGQIIIAYNILFGEPPKTDEKEFRQFAETTKISDGSDEVSVHKILCSEGKVTLYLFSAPDARNNSQKKRIAQHIQGIIENNIPTLLFIHTGGDAGLVLPAGDFVMLSNQKKHTFSGGGHIVYELINSSNRFLPKDKSELQGIIDTLWKYYYEDFSENFFKAL